MRLLLTMIVLLSAAPGAWAADPQIEDGTARAELDAAKALWADQGIDDYVYTVEGFCFCPTQYTDPYTVFVRNGKTLNANKYDRPYSTVDKLLANIQSAIGGRPDGFSAVYDRRGVPLHLGLNLRTYAVDDEFILRVTGFHTGPPTARERLAAARQAWKLTDLDDYDFRLQVGCFCPRSVTKPRTLKVRNGKATNAKRFNRAFSTVEKLFHQIDKALRGKVARLEVKYAKSGLPRSITIDRDENIADEELYLSASRLRKA